MKYLLDTCVISELIKPTPNPKIIAWINHRHESLLFLSVLTIGEIRKGIAKLPDSAKKMMLQAWLDHDLQQRFNWRIIDITEDVAKRWGDIQAAAEQRGVKMPIIDSLIAATGLAHDLTIVTRNVADMTNSGAKLLNLWEEHTHNEGLSDLTP